MHVHGNALKLVTDEPLSKIVKKPALLTIVYGLVYSEKLYSFAEEGKIFHVYPELTVVHDTDGTVTIGNTVYKQGESIPSLEQYRLVYIVYTPNDSIYYTQLRAIQMVSTVVPPEGGGADLIARLEEEIEIKYRPTREKEEQERLQALSYLQDLIRAEINRLVLSLRDELSELASERYSSVRNIPEFAELEEELQEVMEALNEAEPESAEWFSLRDQLADLENEEKRLYDTLEMEEQELQNMNVFQLANLVLPIYLKTGNVPRKRIDNFINSFMEES